MDCIRIEDLSFSCIIGVNPDERCRKQGVLLNIALFLDLRSAAADDDLTLTVDYKTLKKRLVTRGRASRYRLIEALAEDVARTCCREPRVARVQVRVDKPGALRHARTVAVEIERTPADYNTVVSTESD
ncbi:MAG: dihydroneopterin aldolase [Kiritimatiellaeota bacterium]|nr:dihydroneopterin aldolase [Kiritimatiellota bacterium]